MFAISSGHTKTISLRNQMERIIPERLRMENSLSHFEFFSSSFSSSSFFLNVSLQWKRGRSAHMSGNWFGKFGRQKRHQEDSLGLWLWKIVNLFMIPLMIYIKLCMDFRIQPQGMEHYLKNTLFPPYHSEKAHREKVWSESRHSYMKPSLSQVWRERLV